MLNHLVNHQNTQMSAETIRKLQIVIFLDFWIFIITVSSFVGNPVYKQIEFGAEFFKYPLKYFFFRLYVMLCAGFQ